MNINVQKWTVKKYEPIQLQPKIHVLIHTFNRNFWAKNTPNNHSSWLCRRIDSNVKYFQFHMYLFLVRLRPDLHSVKIVGVWSYP